jgi:hypothetical protein
MQQNWKTQFLLGRSLSQRSIALLSTVVTVCNDTCSITEERLHNEARCICGFRMIHDDNFYN